MGLGKCWGPDTRLLMYDGRSKMVKDIQVGDELMGDDSTPRRVQHGSIVRGRGEMFQIRTANRSRPPWTCNADHILVLKLNVRPWIEETPQGESYVGLFHLIDGAGPNSKLPQESRVGPFESIATAQSFLEQMDTYESMIYECTVRDFLTLPENSRARQCSHLYHPHQTIFPPPLYHKSLPNVLNRAAECNISSSPKLVLSTAWVIGVWLTAGNGKLPQCCVSKAHSHAQSVVNKLLSWCRSVYPHETTADFEARVIKEALFGHESTHTIDCGFVLKDLLQTYDMLGSKRVPLTLLTHSIDVRCALLAGMLDGSGEMARSGDCYILSSKERDAIDSYSHLARGLGLSTSEMIECIINDAAMGEIKTGWRCEITGTQLDTWQMIGKSSCSDISSTSVASDGDSFSVTSVGIGDYAGFTLDGNGRCLLGDGSFTVTHNTLQAITLVWTLLNTSPFGKKGAIQKVLIVVRKTTTDSCNKRFQSIFPYASFFWHLLFLISS